jgi:hypothetical protein
MRKDSTLGTTLGKSPIGSYIQLRADISRSSSTRLVGSVGTNFLACLSLQLHGTTIQYLLHAGLCDVKGDVEDLRRKLGIVIGTWDLKKSFGSFHNFVMDRCDQILYAGRSKMCTDWFRLTRSAFPSFICCENFLPRITIDLTVKVEDGWDGLENNFRLAFSSVTETNYSLL